MVITMALFSLRTVGVLLAGVGASHFVAPDVYEPMTSAVFPEDTREWVYRNGASELAIGLALATGKRPLRRIGLVGLAGYLAWLGGNAAKVLNGA